MPRQDQRAIEEIIRKQRSRAGSLLTNSILGVYRYRDLSAWPREALALVPVGVVAVVESVVRDTIRQLVDAGSPFIDRIDLIDLRATPSLEAMKALQGKSITLGEWVSHLVKVSSVEHISSHLTVLFNAKSLVPLLGAIRPFRGPSPVDFGINDPEWEVKEDKDPVINDPARVVASLGRLFAARHRAAHEDDPPILSPETLQGWIGDTILFCTAISDLIESTLRPLDPTNTPMIELKALTDLQRAEGELLERLDQLYAKLSIVPPNENPLGYHWSGLPCISSEDYVALAKRSQEAFEAYKEAELDLQAYFWPDGTGWKTWRMTTELSLVQERSQRISESIGNVGALLFHGEHDEGGETTD